MTTLSRRFSLVPYLLTLLTGLALGGWLTSNRGPVLLAHGGDRWEESILTAGPTFLQYNEGMKVQTSQDAVYYLDYRAGKVYATIPSLKQGVGTSTVFGTFVERDLVADFKLELERGPHPHFLMTTGSMSVGGGGALNDGNASLFVLETTTRQVAVYKIQQQTIGTSQQARFDLLELKAFGATPQ